MSNINTTKTKAKQMFDIVSLSHNDLDGISSQIVIKKYYNSVKMYNCGYNKISEYLEHVDDNCHEFRPSIVYITDLHFEIKYALELSRIIEYHQNIKFVYIDHHHYDDDLELLFKEMNKNNNFTYIHTEKACATKITYKYLSKKFFTDESLSKYVEYVNAYDIWLDKDPLFKGGFLLNELFWNMKAKPFYFNFIDNHNIRDTHKQKYKEIVNDKDKYFKGLKEANLVFEENNNLFIFADSFKSWITIDWKDYDVYVVASTYARMSVRAGNISDEKALALKDYIEKNNKFIGLISLGGHIRAWGITLEDGMPNETIIGNVVEVNKLINQFNEEYTDI